MKDGEPASPAYHTPVMLAEVLGALALSGGEVAVDATLGGGGHAEGMLGAISPDGVLIGIDRDQDAILAAGGRLGWAGDRAVLVRSRMSCIAEVLRRAGMEGADAVLADLGVSSRQLDEAGRGFSIMRDGPLDMRMDRSGGASAAELLESSDAETLEKIFRDYGEERYAGRIARAVAGRKDLRTTAELAETVARSVPGGRRGRIHPATRVFQALRIAVNGELSELESFLSEAPLVLRPRGRLAVISYHSLEDRMVKRAFRELASGGRFELLTRKPIRPGDEERLRNPRSRSAKLRALRRLD